MRSFERLIVDLDVWPWSAAWRAALGLAIPPAFGALAGGRDQVWISIALFVGLLLALRVLPAVMRRLCPFSAEAKAIWMERRQLSKRHDSHQWQKLFWIGLGMLPALAAAHGPRSGELVLALFCLVGGSAGLFVAHKTGAAQPAKQTSP